MDNSPLQMKSKNTDSRPLHANGRKQGQQSFASLRGGGGGKCNSPFQTEAGKHRPQAFTS